MAASLLAVGAVPAPAATAIPVERLLTTPVLAGPTITWAELRRDRVELRSAARDGTDRRLLSRLVSLDDLGGVTLSGSPDGYAVSLAKATPSSWTDVVLEGEPGAPPRTVTTCTRPATFGRFEMVDRGSGALGSTSPCSPGPRALEIRSPASAAEPSARLPGFAGAVSGAYAAVYDADFRELSVIDWRRGTERYRIRAADLAPDGRLSGPQVDAAGTVVFLLDGGGRTSAWTASVADPRPRRIDALGDDLWDMDYAGGVIAYQRRLERNGVEVGTYEPATGRRRTVAREELAAKGVHTDGASLAWEAQRCSGQVLRIASVGEDAHEPRERCRLALLRRTEVRRRTVLLAFRCSGYRVQPCADRLSVRAAGSRGRILARAEKGRGAQEWRGGHLWRVPLTRAGRRILRSGRHRVVITATHVDVYGRAERRSARVTVAR